jgi:cell wall-associated NlpC family hydrolase
MTTLEARERVVKEAREWIGTPYVEAARLKQIGCDCATLIAEVLVNCEIIPREELGFYGRGFNEGEEGNYMLRLLRHAQKKMETIARYGIEAQPGDIALVRVNPWADTMPDTARLKVNHGGIVTKWPYLVHAMAPAVEEINAAMDCCGNWSLQSIIIFDPYAGKFA